MLASAMMLLFTGGLLPAHAQPTVNGLFYGDGDDAKYALWNTSYYTSKLYVQYHAPTTTLYVALVVDRSVNDNVFGSDDFAAYSGDYMQSADWGQGPGQQRGANTLTDSEFASFSFACAENSPREWQWQQGYACLDGTGPDWKADETCGASGVLLNGFPPGYDSVTSFAVNINTYNAQSPKLWDRDAFGTTTADWRSPYSFTDPATVPPSNPNTVVGLEGYPPGTDPDPQLRYNSTYLYEWPMVYEWSMDVGPTGANCANQALFLVTGASHHSPMKAGVEGEFDDECGEENDCFPPDSPNPLSDFGDLPHDGVDFFYTTTTAQGGPRHPILANAPYLGSAVEVEADGTPSADASGDGPEEDGLVGLSPTDEWTPTSTQTITVEVTNASDGAVLEAWFDWSSDGDFDDPGEYFTWPINESGTNDAGTHEYELEIEVGAAFTSPTNDLAVRLRIYSSADAAPGGTLTNGTYSGGSLGNGNYNGVAGDGEVEDYITSGPGTLPVTLNAFDSTPGAGGMATVRWQTASETANVGFEILGLVRGDWRPLSEFVPSADMNSALPKEYEIEILLPEGVQTLELVDYDTHGRPERFGPFLLGASYGEFQEPQRIDWQQPRAQRAQRLAARGFANPGGKSAAASARSEGQLRWRKLEPRGHGRGAGALSPKRHDVNISGSANSIRVEEGASTHVAVTRDGIQRVGYEALRDAGLDLAGVPSRAIAVTWRGQPVARSIDRPGVFGPGSSIDFVGRAPHGPEALYLDANLYQVSVDLAAARPARDVGRSRVRSVSGARLAETLVDRPELYHRQSPTGDPWVEQTVLGRGKAKTVDLEIPVVGPVLDGPARLSVGLGSITDLPEIAGPDGDTLPEHNVEVWFAGPDGDLTHVADASTSGQQDWRLEADLPAGILRTGVNRLQLRFTTEYFLSLVVIDSYGVSYSAPYLGPELDFARDPAARGYRVEGLAGPTITAYAAHADGSLSRIRPRIQPSGSGHVAEIPQLDAERFWLSEVPNTPAVFTTTAPADLLSEPADLVVIADSSFIDTPALNGYLAQTAAFRPVVLDIEDIYNSVGFGMALPGAITDYLRARDEVQPFTHVQLVGADCYDRLNRISDCVSFIPLPHARVAFTTFSPSHNRLVDLDGDGIGDKAVAQFSVRDHEELATIVRKGADWSTGPLAERRSALFVAEETDGIHDFSAQLERLDHRLGWQAIDPLEMADHPNVATARETLRQSLDEGRTLTVFSGHSSPGIWAYRSLLTAADAASLTNVGLPTLMVPLACETTYDVSPDANVLGHQLLYAGRQGALAISGAVALSSLEDNEKMAGHVLEGLDAGLTIGAAVQAGRVALGTVYQTLQDNWMTQGDVTARIAP